MAIVHWLIILVVALVVIGLVAWLLRTVRGPGRRLDRIEERLAAVERTVEDRDHDHDRS